MVLRVNCKIVMSSLVVALLKLDFNSIGVKMLKMFICK